MAFCALAVVLPLALTSHPAGAQTSPPPVISPTPVLSPPPTPPAPATPTPTPLPSPTATATPTSTPTPAPLAAPTANPYAYIVDPTPQPGPVASDAPRILEIAINDRVLHPGGPVMLRVTTTPNVVGVELRAMGQFFAVAQSGPGLFTLSLTVPSSIPFFMLHDYSVVVAAGTADGRQTTVPLSLRLAR
jgi:hypothetical protein